MSTAASNTTATGLRERKKRRTREQLALASVELIAEHGVQQVRVEDVCDRAEIGRSTFFRYFDSKESAFVEGVHLGRLEAVLEALNERPLTETPLDAIRNAMLDAFQDWRQQRDNLLLEARIRAESPSVQAWASASHTQWSTAIAAALAPRFPKTSAGRMQALLLAGVAMTALRVNSDRWLAEGARRSPTTQLDAAFDVLIDLFSAG